MSDQTPAPSAFEQATMSQATGTLKLILAAGGMWLVNHGYLDQGSETEIAGGLAALAVAWIWVLWSRRRNGVLKAAAHALDGNGVIVTDQATADKLPGNVVGSLDAASRVPGVSAR